MAIINIDDVFFGTLPALTFCSLQIGKLAMLLVYVCKFFL